MRQGRVFTKAQEGIILALSTRRAPADLKKMAALTGMPYEKIGQSTSQLAENGFVTLNPSHHGQAKLTNKGQIAACTIAIRQASKLGKINEIDGYVKRALKFIMASDDL